MTQYIVAQKLIRQPCGTFNPRFCENSMSRGDTEKNKQQIWPEKCSFCTYKVSGASSNIEKVQMGQSVSFFIFILSQGDRSSRPEETKSFSLNTRPKTV